MHGLPVGSLQRRSLQRFNRLMVVKPLCHEPLKRFKPLFQLLLFLIKGMKKIDRYILIKYLTTFFFCLILFTAIVVVVDISEKTDNFVKSKLPVARILTDYYFGFIPRIDAMLFPLFVFGDIFYE
jgi:hypothetical protein